MGRNIILFALLLGTLVLLLLRQAVFGYFNRGYDHRLEAALLEFVENQIDGDVTLCEPGTDFSFHAVEMTVRVEDGPRGQTLLYVDGRDHTPLLIVFTDLNYLLGPTSVSARVSEVSGAPELCTVWPHPVPEYGCGPDEVCQDLPL